MPLLGRLDIVVDDGGVGVEEGIGVEDEDEGEGVVDMADEKDDGLVESVDVDVDVGVKMGMGMEVLEWISGSGLRWMDGIGRTARASGTSFAASSS